MRTVALSPVLVGKAVTHFFHGVANELLFFGNLKVHLYPRLADGKFQRFRWRWQRFQHELPEGSPRFAARQALPQAETVLAKPVAAVNLNSEGE